MFANFHDLFLLPLLTSTDAHIQLLCRLYPLVVKLCSISMLNNKSSTTSGPENVSTLRMTYCPDFKFWSVLLVVFTNTALILKVYVCCIGVV